MSVLSERIRNLSPEQIELLLRETEDSAAARAAPLGRRADPEAPAPLSLTQERLVFLDRLSPGSPVYNMHAAFRVRGRLDPEALRRGFEAVIARHEVLRSTFGGEPPRQRVARPGRFDLERLDLSGLPADERRRGWRRAVEEAARHGFDLANGPLLRALLIGLEEGEQVLSVVLHHVVADGWSVEILVGEVTAFYAACAEGSEPSPAPLPVQFGDFAAWQRERFDDGRATAHLAYWHRHLADAPPVIELAADRPRPVRQRFAGAEERLRLEPRTVDGLREVAERHGATLYMTLLALYGVLLARYSGQDDVLIGSPVAGRDEVETEVLIGPFVDTVVRRVDLRDAPTFVELLGRVRDDVLRAAEHGPVPFEKLVEVLQPERTASHSPLFQVWFVLHNAPRPAVELPGLVLEPLAIHDGTTKFDLTLSAEEREGGLDLVFEYDTDLFAAETVAALAQHFATLAAAVAGGAAGRPAGELPLAGPEARRELWALGTAGAAPGGTESIEALLEDGRRQARAEAGVVLDDTRLSYDELAVRSCRLARHLADQGVAPGTVVALCLPRSLDLLVAVLSTLRAGGAPAVLEPTLPPDRLEMLFEDLEPEVLVTLDDLLYGLPVVAMGSDLVLLDSEASEIAEHPDEAPPATAEPDDPAYVIYTSGSTGRPKGVEVERGPLARHLTAVAEVFGIGPADRVLQFASFSFDVAYEQALAALTRGAGLVMRGEEAWTARRLSERIRDEGVTVVNLPTGFWQQWVAAVAEGEAAAPGDSLRLVVVGGDVLGPDAVRRWFGSPLASVRLLNAYGPTEGVITATVHEVTPADAEAGRVPLGSPLPGRSVHLLDGAGEPVPAGVPGEIHLADPFLARGYRERPEETAAAFVDGTSGGGRLYRTGDLGRRRADGTLEFLGRRDQQVKVRGFRIELAEVEEALAGYRKVRAAAAAVRGGDAADRRLIGYVVPVREDEPPSAGELREHLSERLPDYAVPSAFVVLGELPTTPSGKLDRRALPDAAPGESAGGGGEWAAPRTDTERTVAEIWQEVLGVERVGVHDNFFELGGHSLLATQVIGRIADRTGVDLPIQTLLTRAEVAALSEAVDAERGEPTSRAAAAIEPVPRDRPLPLSFQQERLWIFEHLVPDTPAYNVPAVLELHGDLDADALREAFAGVIGRHEVLRTTFRATDEDPVQEIGDDRPPELERHDLSELEPEARGEALGERVVELARRPFDLEQGPLLRVALIALEPARHVLVLVLHHLVTDGWSLGRLVGEVAELYTAAREDRPPRLPDLPVQYADYAAWQRHRLAGDRLEERLGYWRRRLDGVAELELPTDRPRPAAAAYRGAFRAFELSAELSEAVRSTARAADTTPFVVMVAALAAVLHRASGQDDVAIGTAVANRERPETEPLIGFFVNLLVLRLDLAGGPTFEALVERARETSLSALDHQDVPFEKVVEALAPERSRDRNPLFQVLFVLQNAPLPRLELPGLRIEPRKVDAGTAHFDLTIEIVDRPEGFQGIFEYDTELFEHETAERLLDAYRRLLAEAVGDPARAVADLPLGDETGPGDRFDAQAAFGDRSFALEEPD
jgi:amino acid adenylation domain-containing protein